MAQTFQFPGTATALLQSSSTLPRRPHRAKRPTGNKFQEIAFRSPADMRALDVIADHILARLNKADAEKEKRTRRTLPLTS